MVAINQPIAPLSGAQPGASPGIGAYPGGIPPPPATNGPNAPLAQTSISGLSNPISLDPRTGGLGVSANAGAFANQQIGLYEAGQLPAGEQAAINEAATSSEGALSAQLAQEGIDPASSSQFAGGSANIAIAKSTATQQALQQVLQNAFQAQGITLQADQVANQLTEFEQQLSLEYLQTSIQQSEFQQSLQSQQKGQIGSLFGSLAKVGGGLL
jgi:hypothetical protein